MRSTMLRVQSQGLVKRRPELVQRTSHSCLTSVRDGEGGELITKQIPIRKQQNLL